MLLTSAISDIFVGGVLRQKVPVPALLSDLEYMRKKSSQYLNYRRQQFTMRGLSFRFSNQFYARVRIFSMYDNTNPYCI